jgi:signal transduction histidine kinase
MVRTTSGGLWARLRADPLIGDSVLAALLAAVSLWVALAFDSGGVAGPALTFAGLRRPDTPGAVLLVLACLCAAPRRRWPYALLCLNQALMIVLSALGYNPSLSGVAGLVLIYTVAAYRGLALSLVGVATAVAGHVLTGVSSGTPPDWTYDALTSALTLAAWMGGRSIRLRRAYLAELEDRAERLERARDADRRAARAEERSRIARELHDVVAHHVSVMTVQAAAARKVLASSPDAAADALSAIEEMGRTAMAEMRNIVGVLRTDGEEGGERAPQPGIHDLPTLVEQMREAGLRTQLWIEGDEPRLPPGVDLAAYRLIQEALTNSLRHAGPSARAWVTVRHEPSVLTVHVEDDGHGPAARPRRANGDRPGHGLVGIRERVALYGGILRIGPRQGGGFEVRARFPLKTGQPPG